MRFRSKFEAEVAMSLDRLGVSFEFEPDKIPFQPPPRVYIPDFYNEYESIIPKKICRKWIFESRVTAHPLESIISVISLKSVKLWLKI